MIHLQRSPQPEDDESLEADHHRSSPDLMCLESGISDSFHEGEMFNGDSALPQGPSQSEVCSLPSFDQSHSISQPETKQIIRKTSETEVVLRAPSCLQTENIALSKRKMSSTSSTESSTEGETPSIKSEGTETISSSVGPASIVGPVSISLQSTMERQSSPLEITQGVGMTSTPIGVACSPQSSGPRYDAALASCPTPPRKSLRMSHLHKKYHAELEYMLKEFRKLESQLLGAKGNGTGVQESEGSRERREKLHSFILHLEDTLQQIEIGVRLETDGDSTPVYPLLSSEELSSKQVADSSILTKVIKENEDEENVQKLEEHILANLLPVKVRLKKQLAAQQGATRNPVGMPTARRGMLQPSAATEKGTFAVAAEQRLLAAQAARAATELQAPASPIGAPTAASQYGRPLSVGCSSLTQKLHGSLLGSKKRPYCSVAGSQSTGNGGDGAQQESSDDVQGRRKIFYGGLAPGSEQLRSGVSAAAGAHKMHFESPALVKSLNPPLVQAPNPVPSSASAELPPYVRPHATKCEIALPDASMNTNANVALHQQTTRTLEEPAISEEEKKRLRKVRRNKKKRREASRKEKERQKQIFLQQQVVQSQIPKVVGKKGGKGGMLKIQGKKKGPRSVEYICALCSEAYGSTCDHNPWWALTSHECPKCRKTQVPRVDITSSANAIEYHPALLAHADEAGGNETGGSPPQHASVVGVIRVNPGQSTAPSLNTANTIGTRKFQKYPNISMSDSEDSEFSDLSDGPLSDFSADSEDSDDLPPLSPAEQAENENFGFGYCGPVLADADTKRLLILMGHASTCPGRHKSAKHRDVCSSTKYLMLHVRDCPGTTSTFDICPFPWCRKVKHVLYHLVSCQKPKACFICNTEGLSANLAALSRLNSHRREKQREHVMAAMASTVAAAKTKPKNLVRLGVPRRVPPVSVTKPPIYRPVPGARPCVASAPSPPSRSVLKPAQLATPTTNPRIAASSLISVNANGANPNGIAARKPIVKPLSATQPMPRPTNVLSSTTRMIATHPLASAPMLQTPTTHPASAIMIRRQSQCDHHVIIATSPKASLSPENVSTSPSEDHVSSKKGKCENQESSHVTLTQASVGGQFDAMNETTSAPGSQEVLECLDSKDECTGMMQSSKGERTPLSNVVTAPLAKVRHDTSSPIVFDAKFQLTDQMISEVTRVQDSLVLDSATTEEGTRARHSPENQSKIQVNSAMNIEEDNAPMSRTVCSTQAVDAVSVAIASLQPSVKKEFLPEKTSGPMLPQLPSIITDEDPSDESASTCVHAEVDSCANMVVSNRASGSVDAQVPQKVSTETSGLEESEKKVQTVEIGC